MAMSEEAIIAVSEDSSTVDGDTIVVREAWEMPRMDAEPMPVNPQKPKPLPIVMPPADIEPPENVEGEPKGWLDSQNAKDFEPFLIGEMRRIKPPSACIRSRNEAERALGQYKKLNSYVSKALREDWGGEIPIEKIDQLRQQLEQNVEALERMLVAHQDMKKQRKQVRRHRRAADGSTCPDCAAPLWEENGSMVCLACDQTGLKKEAATPHFEGLQYQISAFERAVVGTLINAVVAGGRDLEELFAKLEKKYKLEAREVLAVRQILSDMGYPVFKDRARMGEDEDPTDPDEPREWQAQYHA